MSRTFEDKSFTASAWIELLTNLILTVLLAVTFYKSWNGTHYKVILWIVALLLTASIFYSV